MPKFNLGLKLLLLALATTSMSIWAQQADPGSRVIVVFNENAPFQAFRGNFHLDERAQANPKAWGYLDHGVAGAVQALEAKHGFRANHIYSSAVRGFAANLTQRQIADLKNDSMVKYVEADSVMHAISQVIPWGIDRVGADISSTRAGDGQGAVSNVHVYIVDTGVDTSHPDLNVINHVNFANGKNADCNGHGTHVAGTVAAKDDASDVVGVAPGAPITGVKVLDCSGSGYTSTIIKGIDWVTANAVKPAVANLSLGGNADKTLDAAVMKSADSGVFYSVAAGNFGLDACLFSPSAAALHDGIMGTAATDSSDREASFSDYGTCVDTWAPGVNILSTKLGGGTLTLSGTSMAAPHVAGSAALYLSSHPSATPAEVEEVLKSNAVLVPGSTTCTGKGKNRQCTGGGTSKDGRAIQIVNDRLY